MVFKGEFPQSFIALSKTATDDLKFTITGTDLWFREINIHVTTNDALYGDHTLQPATVTAGDIVSFQDVNLNEIFFRNATPAANTVIYAVGNLMTIARKKELGIL